MDTADTTLLKLSQNALLKALVGDLVCMYDVNVQLGTICTQLNSLMTCSDQGFIQQLAHQTSR